MTARAALLPVLLLLSGAAAAAPVELAITVDDLPAHGDAIPGVSRVEIASEVVSALKDAGVPQAYGFCNIASTDSDTDFPVLDLWKAAGYPLGNHTASHPDLSRVGADAFIADIAQEDAQLASLSPPAQRHTFRFPYLQEGATLDQRNAVRAYLKANGYRVAEVTVDYEDWAWTDAYGRCLANQDREGLHWLKENIVKAALIALKRSESRARIVAGRPVKQILLMHVGAFDGLMLKDVLAAYRAAGVKFISLDDALSDPIYAVDPAVPLNGGKGFLEQLAMHKRILLDPADLTYSEERLSRVCVAN